MGKKITIEVERADPGEADFCINEPAEETQSPDCFSIIGVTDDPSGGVPLSDLREDLGDYSAREISAIARGKKPSRSGENRVGKNRKAKRGKQKIYEDNWFSRVDYLLPDGNIEVGFTDSNNRQILTQEEYLGEIKRYPLDDLEEIYALFPESKRDILQNIENPRLVCSYENDRPPIPGDIYEYYSFDRTDCRAVNLDDYELIDEERRGYNVITTWRNDDGDIIQSVEGDHDSNHYFETWDRDTFKIIERLQEEEELGL